MRQLSSHVDIQAPVDTVWRVLSDLPAYGSWNPYVTSISGTLRPGERLRVRLEPPGGRPMTMHPRVVAAEPGHELRWLGHLLVPGLFDGEHAFLLASTGPGSCRVTQAETFRGVLVPLATKVLGPTLAGFERMNEALRRRAEAEAGVSA